MQKKILIMIIILLPVICFGEKSNHTALQDALNLINVWIESQQSHDEIPGISIAIVHDQKVIGRLAFGYSNSETKIKTTTETIYSICSKRIDFSASVMMVNRVRKLNSFRTVMGKLRA